MANPLSEAIFRLMRSGRLQPYTGPTYGVEKIHPGTRFYSDPSLGKSGIEAEVPVGVNAIVVGPNGLTLDAAMHELTHLQQPQGWLANPSVVIQNLLTRLRGQDPAFQSPREEQAYRVQRGVLKQMQDKKTAAGNQESEKNWDIVRRFLTEKKP